VEEAEHMHANMFRNYELWSGWRRLNTCTQICEEVGRRISVEDLELNRLTNCVNSLEVNLLKAFSKFDLNGKKVTNMHAFINMV
jgi:hypothetical protein